MPTETNAELAIRLDKRAREIESQASTLFVDLGVICRIIQDKELWRHILASDGQEFRSFDAWVQDALPWSNGTAYSALGVARDCEDIPIEERRQMPRGNLEILRQVSPHIRRDPKIQERAKRTKPQQFVKELAAEHPQEHLEGKSQMKFNPTVSQREVVEKAIELAYAVGDATTREEAIECICQFYGEENACRLGQQREVGKLKHRVAVQ